MSKTKDIELRSEKVRNIIGQIPSRIVRVGITIIFVVVVGLLSGAYFFKFDNTIDAIVKLNVENHKIGYEVRVPYNKLKTIKTGQKVVILIHDTNTSISIQHIDTALHIAKEQSYFIIRGVVENAKFQLDEPIEAPARIYTGKINIIDYILNR